MHEGSELRNVVERRERVLRCGDDNGRGFASPTTSGSILGMLEKLRLRIDSTGYDSDDDVETSKREALAKALQTAKNLEWRNRPSMGHDNGDDADKSKREALAESGRMGTSRSVARDPTLGFDRNPDAARVHDETTSMGRVELVEQGLSKLHTHSCLTVAV